ncbi:leukocyte surface antigen CD53 isoform X1 [Gracilinanus agilis]|uniref:leukocyte surface antigen CD53 isoform X1 n=1 Tax=Gracilinanus agilis TaxID=191870 RepID=UPI001CFDB51B|nr:leukocyte surface antigen CD53 isoform X1 [Gracilinanus agilis]
MSMNSLKVLKYVVFFFNLLFWVCGCTILGFGIYFLMKNSFGSLFYSLPSLTLGNVVIIVGSIIMVVAFLGCMGSIKENKCLLMSFFVLLLFILLTEVIMAILLFAYEQKGCYVKAKLWFQSNFLYIGILIISVCVIQVLGMSFALTLNCQIEKTSQSLGI